MSISVNVGSATFTPPVSGPAVTSTSILGSGTGAVTFGQVFREGDVPGGIVSMNGAQVDVKTTWPDGSAAIAVVSGILTGGQSYDLVASSGSSGSNLTESQLITALGTTTITLTGSATGTVNAADLISGAATPAPPGKLAWQDGQYCIERIVGAQLSGTIYGFFHCRYYSNGALSVDFVIENCEAISADADSVSGVTVALTLDGVQRASFSLEGAQNRAMETFWNTDPDLMGSMDRAYFLSCNLTPTYPDQPCSPGAEGTQVLAPFDLGGHRNNYDDTGADKQIAVLARWDVAAIRNGTKSAITGAINDAKAGNHRGIIYKDNSTGYPVSPVDYPQANKNGWGGPLRQGAGTLFGSSKESHMPSCGYIAYLLTGKYYFWETVWYWGFQAQAAFVSGGGSDGEYSNRTSSYFDMKLEAGQHRSSAWRMRCVLDVWRACPDSFASVKATYGALLQDSIDYLHSTHVVGAADNQFGWIDSNQDWPQTRPWQHNWLHASIYECIRSGVAGTNATAVSVWLSRWIRNLLSFEGNTDWCWQFSAMSSHNGLPSQGGSDTASSWADFMQQKNGTQSCSLTGVYDRNPDNPTDYAAQLGWTVMVAYQIGVLTATETQRHLNGFTTADFDGSPEWSMVEGEQVIGAPNGQVEIPAGQSVSASQGQAVISGGSAGLPTWAQSTPVGEWSLIPSSGGFATPLEAMQDDMGLVDAQAIDAAYGGNDSESITKPWCGGAYAGDYLTITGGGHTDSAVNGAYRFGPLTSDTPGWSTAMKASIPADVISGTDTTADGKWNSNHTYNNCAGADGQFWLMRTDAYYVNAGGSSKAWRLPQGVNQTPVSVGNTVSQGGAYGCTSVIGSRIYHQNGNGGTAPLTWFDYTNLQTGVIPETGTETWPNYVAMAADSDNDALVVTNSNKTIYFYSLSTSPQKRTINDPPGTWYENLEYDADRDVFVTLDRAANSTATSLTIRELSASSLRSGGTPSWTSRTFTGPSLPSEKETTFGPAGIYGRFRYVPSLKGYIYAPRHDAGCYYFRATL